MTHSLLNTHQPRSISVRIGGLVMALLALVLLAVSPASAAYEQAGHFAGILPPTPKPANPSEFPESVQLGGVGGMAVNYTGTGGVPAGTVYAVTRNQTLRISMFEPSGASLAFKLGWEVTPKEPYERCGPLLGTKCPNQPENLVSAVDVDVDQATGNVYVFSGNSVGAGSPTVAVYNPDGSEVIARFAERAPEGTTTASTPDEVHRAPYPGGLAVDSAGTVYLFDLNPFDNFYHRLMVFKPQTPNDYEHYVYQVGGDIGAGFQGEGEFPSMPVTDTAGDIYVAGEGHVQKYTPSQPKTPICKFELKTGGITAMTVNPATGEPFYYSYKNKQLHQLSTCEGGKFSEVPPAIGVTPERDNLYALAFDPSRQLELSRTPGILYGAAPQSFSGSGKGEPGMGSLGYIFAPPRELNPEVLSESVAHVTSSTAELGAQINPKGSETSYAFQYISETAYEENEPADRFAGATEAPPGGALLGAGQEALSAAAALSGLAPDTTYHYRAIASSHCSTSNPEKVCEDTGEDQVFNTFPIEAPGLPDNRAYELVSPVQKNGGQVYPADPGTSSCGLLECKPGSAYQHFPMQSSPDGEAIVYEGSPFSATEGAVIENQYLSRRDPQNGWHTADLSLPLANSKGGGDRLGYKAFDASLTKGLFVQISPSLSPEAPSDFANLYLQPTGTPTDLSSLLVSEPPNRVAGEVANGFHVTYAGASADFSRFFFEANDALTEETPFAPEALDGGEKKSNLYEWSEGQLRLVNVMPGNAATIPGASFGSGTLLKAGNPNSPSSVFSHAISDDGSRVFWSDEAGQVYVRENGESTKTIPDPGKFLSASADGSRMLLANGHVYDLESEATTDLSEGKGGFLGLVGQSDDLSHLYFVDTAVLDEGENDQGDKAQAGKDNLYAWSEGASIFIATLLAGDNETTAVTGDWRAALTQRTAEASPDGRWVAFLSQARLTGYDNTGPCEVIGETGEYAQAPCREVFLYDSATGALTCASCNPSGTRPLGRSTLRLIFESDGALPQPRYLSDEGRLYFDSGDSLTLSDTNDGVEDVYQYEPNGIGSCKREAGCVSLISAGREGVDSNFLSMDESGKNVFFTTRDQLVLKDKDDLLDLYVAREGGGIPAESEVARGECQGEACQGVFLAPNDPTPGSSTFEGAGNVDEKKAAKKHKKKSAKKKKHAKKHKKSSKRAHQRAAKHNRGGAK